MNEDGARGFRIAFAVLSLAALAPLWTVDFLPLTDLPQHEAQVSVLRHWQEPDCGYPQVYEIRWFSPYWLTYALAWALAGAVAIPTTFKILLSAIVLGIGAITAVRLRELGGDPWWALACLPLAYGYPTSWGFVSFLAAVPWVLLLLGPGFRHARSPTRGSGVALGLGCAALFFVHILALLYAGLLLAAMIAVAAPSPRAFVARAAPLAIALPLPLAWWWHASGAVGAPIGRVLWLGGFSRLTELPILLTAIPHAGLAALALAPLVLALAAHRPRPAREGLRWAPFLVTAAIVLVAPNYLFGTAYLAPRFAIYLVPTLLFALDRRPERAASRPARWGVAAAALALLVVVEVRFLGIAREGEGLAEVLAAAPPDRHLLYLCFDRGSRWSSETPFLHSGMRYTTRGCGFAERSFARNFQYPVAQRTGAAPPLPGYLEVMPERFRWDRHGGAHYDLFLIRAKREPQVEKIAGAAGRLEPLAHAGRWWLYANTVKAPAPGPPP